MKSATFSKTFYFRGNAIQIASGTNSTNNSLKKIEMAHASLNTISGFFAKNEKMIDPNSTIFAFEEAPTSKQFKFECMGNMVWGDLSRGAMFKILTLRGALIHKPHFISYLLRKLLLQHGIIRIEATLPQASPFLSLFSTIKKADAIQLEVPHNLSTYPLHFYL